MLTTFLAHFRRRPDTRPLPTPEVVALNTRIDHTSSVLACVFMRRNLHHAQARAALLEGRSRGLVATVSDQAQTIQALRAQLDAARTLLDRRTVALRVAEERWAEEAQRVIDLEDEARDWITRAREPVGLQRN